MQLRQKGLCARGRSAGAGRLSRGAVFVLCRSCDSIGMSCVCSRPSCVPLGMSCVRSRLLFAAWRQTERLAGCCVPIPPWVVIAGSAFSNHRCGYRAFLVHFGRARFFMAIPTGARPEFAYTKRSAASGGRFFRYGFMIRHDTAGSTLGLRAPNLRQRAIGSLDSLHLIRGVGAFHAARASRVQRRLERLQ